MTVSKQDNSSQSLKTNMVFSFVLQLFTFLLPLITAPYLSRVLGSKGVGDYALGSSVISYFSILIAFGFVSYGTKYVSILKSDKKELSITFWNIFFSKFIFFIVCFCAYYLMAFYGVFGNLLSKKFFYIIGLTLFGNLFDISFLYQGLEKFKFISLINLAAKIISLVFLFIFVNSPSDLEIYAIIQIVYLLFVDLIYWIVATSFVSRPNFRSLSMWQTIKDSFFLFLPSISISIYMILDKTMLGYICNTTEVGYYEEAYKIVSLVTSVITSIAPVMLSRMSSLFTEKNKEEIEKKISNVFELIALIGFPAIGGLYTISSTFLPIYFGSEYSASVPIIYFLIPLVILVPTSSLLGSSYYVPSGNIKVISLFYASGAIVNFLGNIFILKYLKGVGAAITSLIAESLISFLFVWFSRKQINYTNIMKTMLKPLLCTFVMLIVIIPLYFLLEPTSLSRIWFCVVLVLAGAISYSFACFFSKEKVFMSLLLFFRTRFDKEKTKNGNNEKL